MMSPVAQANGPPLWTLSQPFVIEPTPTAFWPTPLAPPRFSERIACSEALYESLSCRVFLRHCSA